MVARERSTVLVSSALFTFIAYGQRTRVCYSKDKHVIATLNGEPAGTGGPRIGKETRGNYATLESVFAFFKRAYSYELETVSNGFAPLSGRSVYECSRNVAAKSHAQPAN